MNIKKFYFIPVLVGLIIGIIHGIFLEPSLNIFLSWISLGFWLSFSIKVIAKIRNYKRYSSPHNTSFFILGINTIGIFYFYSGYFTELMDWEFFRELQSYTLINPWILMFAVPYLMYGLYSLYKAIKKYQVIYIYKSKSVRARGFAIFYAVAMFINNIIFLFIIVLKIEVLFFTPIYSAPGLVYILHNLFLVILIIYGLAQKRTRIRDLSPELIEQRRARVESIQSAQIEPTSTSSSRSPSSRNTQRRARPTTARTTTSRSARKPASRTRPSSPSTKSSSASQKTTKPKPKSTTTAKRRKLTPQQQKQLIAKYKRLKPKTTMLTLDDFKCIFCFSLPKYPEDKGRRIVLCPKCNYPAHANEFKEWMRGSDLCSRCSAQLPSSYKRNPKTISVKLYSDAIKFFRKKGGF